MKKNKNCRVTSTRFPANIDQGNFQVSSLCHTQFETTKNQRILRKFRKHALWITQEMLKITEENLKECRRDAEGMLKGC